MQTLFNVDPLFPEGFTYLQDFITAEEETQLINAIPALNPEPMKFHQYVALRKVTSFGRGWSFTEQKLTEGKEIPAEFEWLADRIAKHLVIDIKQIAQFLVTEYPPGSVINWHRDAPPFDIIAGVSLQSDCVFKLRPHKKELHTRAATLAFNVSARSLYTMQGQAKTDWQHSTAPVKSARYSLTFRTLK